MEDHLRIKILLRNQRKNHMNLNLNQQKFWQKINLKILNHILHESEWLIQKK
nr:MAG TPA: hypothetical protein [Caudoviricetes sp.]